MELKVFISYNWHNTVLRDLAVKTAFGIQNVKVYYDRDGTRAPEAPLLESIASELASSHCLIVFLTEQSVGSAAVREEMIRAHSRRLCIIPIVDDYMADKTNWDTHAPWFLRDTDYIRYSPTDPALIAQELARRLSQLCSRRTYFTLIDHLRSIERTLYDGAHVVHEFQAELLHAILHDALKEVGGVTQLAYRENLSSGALFLSRAGPLFQKASSIHATSLDSISTFWVNPLANDKKQARTYIDNQPDSTKRLFVFREPSTAHYYSQVLNAHYQRYGAKTGGVFLCSSSSYKKIVSRLADRPSIRELEECDFAVLAFDSGAEYQFVSARLSEQELRLDTLPTRSAKLDASELKQIFDNWMSLQEGSISDESGVIRWGCDLHKSPAWPDLLRRAFDPPGLFRDAYHIVLFRTAEDESVLRSEFVKVKHDVINHQHSASKDFGIKDIWFGKRQAYPVLDGLHGGLLQTGNPIQFPFALIIRFENREGLIRYYQDEEHSRIRRRLYESFGTFFVEGFNEIKKLRLTKRSGSANREQIRVIYDRMEIEAAKYMTRYDYEDDEEFLDIVKRPPFEFLG